MSDNDLRMACAAGAARCRRLACGLTFVSVPDDENNPLLVDAEAARLDLTKCRRLSRGACCRIVRRMPDRAFGASDVRAFYLVLIAEGGKEVTR